MCERGYCRVSQYICERILRVVKGGLSELHDELPCILVDEHILGQFYSSFVFSCHDQVVSSDVHLVMTTK